MWSKGKAYEVNTLENESFIDLLFDSSQNKHFDYVFKHKIQAKKKFDVSFCKVICV